MTSSGTVSAAERGSRGHPVTLQLQPSICAPLPCGVISCVSCSTVNGVSPPFFLIRSVGRGPAARAPSRRVVGWGGVGHTHRVLLEAVAPLRLDQPLPQQLLEPGAPTRAQSGAGRQVAAPRALPHRSYSPVSTSLLWIASFSFLSCAIGRAVRRRNRAADPASSRRKVGRKSFVLRKAMKKKTPREKNSRTCCSAPRLPVAFPAVGRDD